MLIRGQCSFPGQSRLMFVVIQQMALALCLSVSTLHFRWLQHIAGHEANPAVAVRLQYVVVEPVQILIEVTRVQVMLAPVADAQQAVDKGAECVDATSQTGGAGEANGGRGPPAAVRALGENAHVHSVPHWKEREDVVRTPSGMSLIQSAPLAMGGALVSAGHSVKQSSDRPVQNNNYAKRKTIKTTS